MPAILEEHGEIDEAAAARKAAVAAEEEARREAEAAAEAASARGFLAGHTKFERTFAKIEAEREAEQQEEIRAKERRAAYLRRLIASEGEPPETSTSVDAGSEEDSNARRRADGSSGPPLPTRAFPAIAARDEAVVGLDARLDRWEAEHARRVAAARARKIDFEDAVIAPNSARTKEDERREEEARTKAAAAAAAAAAEVRVVRVRVRVRFRLV